MGERKRKYGLPLWVYILAGTIMGLLVWFKITTRMPPPGDPGIWNHRYVRMETGVDSFRCGESWLQKNEYGLWEMYLEGDEISLGLKNGVLAKDLIRFQEEVFVERLREMVPGSIYIRMLKHLIVWMNRNMDRYVPPEYQKEIYGVALEASDSFSFIGPNYARILNYHAAHDIGHALQNMNLVACTAVGVKDGRSADGKLLVGRNFDFSMGDAFARDKIIAFYKPEKGIPFVSVTWGGLIGVVSGMNAEGLAVSLNAAKSGIPRSTRTPVSILARQILQHASNIGEAWEIAAATEVFVSESFLVSSAADGLTVVIEKSPEHMALYDPRGDTLILTNHFQSDTFLASERTRQNIAEGASMYRWERSLELLQEQKYHDVHSMASLLRDRAGKSGADIGLGNEKAVNQLVAHHSVIFEPEEGRMWVSCGPYQLGTYLCYDLGYIFSDRLEPASHVHEENLIIAEDPFLLSSQYRDFRQFRTQTETIRKWLGEKRPDANSAPDVEAYLDLNPSYYYAHYLAGEVYRTLGKFEKARKMYLQALDLEIPRLVDREQVEEALASANEKINEE